MAFGLAAGIMSPVFTALLSSWGYKTINLVFGCVALIVGLAASTLIRSPEAHLSAPAADTAIEPTSRSVIEALKTREFWCLWLTWVLAGAAGASMLVLATGFGLASGLSLSQAVVLLTGFIRAQPNHGDQLYVCRRRLLNHAPCGRHLAVGHLSGGYRLCFRNPVCSQRTDSR
jgi:hypothetical protein